MYICLNGSKTPCPAIYIVNYDYIIKRLFGILAKLFLKTSTMASLLKVQKANAAKFDTKNKGKRKADDMDVDVDEPEVSVPKKKKNKQRVLLLSSRGITHRMRHFMNDLEALLPHVKKGTFRRNTYLLRCY
jgi:hypothetical protein